MANRIPKGEVTTLKSYEQLQFIVCTVFEKLSETNDRLVDNEVEGQWIFNFTDDERVLRMKLANFKKVLTYACKLWDAETGDTSDPQSVLKDLKKIGLVFVNQTNIRPKDCFGEYCGDKPAAVIQIPVAFLNFLLDAPLMRK